jgi:hypothetical protein
MIRRQFGRRALRDIGRDLADSDPRLGELFRYFNERTSGGKIPCTEKIRARPLGLLARIGRRMPPLSADLDRITTWWP